VERVRTELRNEASKKQQDSIADALLTYGYAEIPRPRGRHITSLDDVPRGQFMRNAWLAGKDCDVAVRLRDGRLLALECKVSTAASTASSGRSTMPVVKQTSGPRRSGPK
jgi:hypothetical protein